VPQRLTNVLILLSLPSHDRCFLSTDFVVIPDDTSLFVNAFHSSHLFWFLILYDKWSRNCSSCITTGETEAPEGSRSYPEFLNVFSSALTYLTTTTYKHVPNRVINFVLFFEGGGSWGLNSGPSLWATPPALFLWRVFQHRVSWTICLGWLPTTILLISASWVTRITGMSHRHPAILFSNYRNAKY
jgi:hypothetical protein